MSDEPVIKVTWIRQLTMEWVGQPSELPEAFRPSETISDIDDLTQAIFTKLDEPDYSVDIDVRLDSWRAFENASNVEDEDVSIESVEEA